MTYVIQRIEDGKFVTVPGSAHSYTDKLQNAKLFYLHQAALDECCGNERVLTLEQAVWSHRA